MGAGRKWVRAAIAAAVFGLAGAGVAAVGLTQSDTAGERLGQLHVASPDWRDQVIYFLVTDRFADGDTRNNDQGAGEFNPKSRSHFSGGDLIGVRQRLDYIAGLGATAVWVTPPVENQWLDGEVGYGGYHGYWASNFMRADPHFGTLEDYQALSRALHGRGMYLVQDIVLNHTGNFFNYGADFDPKDPAKGYTANTQSKPMGKPTQYPFSLNDPRNAQDRAAGIYRWTPTIADLSDRSQELTWQLSGLDDLNTDNPAVRKALRQSYGFWIKEAGVDAYRVDTAFYVEPELFEDFLNAKDPDAPGILAVAKQTGRTQFHVFGEGFGVDRPFADVQARKIERYMTASNGKPLMPGMINFPLYGAFGDVFARGRAPAELGFRIQSMMQRHRNVHLMPTFIDNHDVDRFLSGGGLAGMKQAMLAMMTLPGIPVIYYGTEQGFRDQRASMFSAGWGAGGRDWFDTGSDLYRYTARAVALRRTNRLFSRGAPSVLQAAEAGPGAIAYRMEHEGEAALVAFNTAERPMLLANLAVGAPANVELPMLFSIDGAPVPARVGGDGRLSVILPARAGAVWRIPRASGGAPRQLQSAVRLSPVPAVVRGGVLTVTGFGPPRAEIALVLDGDVTGAQKIMANETGAFSAQVRVDSFVDPAAAHTLVARDAVRGQTSQTLRFKVAPQWREVALVSDPAGDDTGPPGRRYLYPTDPTFAPRTMDIRRARLFASGGSLRIDLEMGAISQVWNPQNGFDHVAFTVFIETPGRGDGLNAMPLQRATLPDGMRWHVRLRAHGWSNAAFTTAGAGPSAEGEPAERAATVSVDAGRRTVRLIAPADALGGLTSLTGARVYITTWDYDGGYRALAGAAGPFVMGGAQTEADPKWMDAIGPIRIP
jgi:glycosidase